MAHSFFSSFITTVKSHALSWLPNQYNLALVAIAVLGMAFCIIDDFVFGCCLNFLIFLGIQLV